MLSIFNNGSYTWLLLIADILWAAIWGYMAYKGHKKGYKRQLPGGGYETVKGTLWNNANFIMLIIGVVAITGFMFWINSDYQ